MAIPIFVHVPKCAGNTIFQWTFGKIAYFGHSPILHIKKILGDIFEKVFIFSIVRNPYDRLLSAYTYLKQPHENESWISIWGQSWSIKCVSQYPTFKDFVMNFNESMKCELHFRPQFQFLYLPPNDLHVNLLMKFEELPNYFAALKEMLRIDKPIPKEKVNATQHLDWREVYTDEMLKIVNKYYETDFQIFRYKMGR